MDPTLTLHQLLAHLVPLLTDLRNGSERHKRAEDHITALGELYQQLDHELHPVPPDPPEPEPAVPTAKKKGG